MVSKAKHLPKFHVPEGGFKIIHWISENGYVLAGIFWKNPVDWFLVKSCVAT